MDHRAVEFASRERESGGNTFFENNGTVGSQIGVQNVAGSVYTTYNFNYGSDVANQESTVNNGVLSSEDSAILNSLAFPQMLDRRSDIDPAHPATCEWIFKAEEFLAWTELPSGLLWIKGKPGSGKSTLMNVIYDRIKDSRDSSNATCLDFFFSARGVILQQSPVGMLRSLINQIFLKAVTVRSLIRKIYKEKCASFGFSGTGWEWKQPELEKLFVRCVLQATKVSKVDIFVDALDEAGDTNSRAMARYFHDLNKSVIKTSSGIKICISCRHYPIPTTIKGLEVVVENHNTADIRRFVHDRLNANSSISDLENADIGQWPEIEQEMVARANGVFQWAHIVLLLLEEAISEGESQEFIQEQLRQVPDKLEQVYEHIIRNVIKTKNRSQSYLLFQLVCFAERPLSLLDLRFAMAANDFTPATAHIMRCDETKNFVDSDRRMEQRVIVLSGGLIDVIKPQRPYGAAVHGYAPYGLGSLHFALLAHETVKEYLMKSGLTLLHSLTSGLSSTMATPHASLTFSPNGAQYHSTLYWICLLYLRSISAQPQLPDDEEYSIHISGEVSNNDAETFIGDLGSPDEVQWWFSQYAAAYMLSHAAKAESGRVKDVAEEVNLLTAVLPAWIENFLLFSDEIEDERSPYRVLNENTTVLHMAVYAGLLDIVHYVVQSGGNIDAPDERGFTPFHVAASRGYLGIVKILHAVGADLAVETRDRVTPLVLAARGGHVTIVKWLIERGVSIEPKSEDLNSVLSEALAQGQTPVARLLLDAGANVNVMSGDLGAAITVASFNGHDTAVSMLLQAGADVNIFNGPRYGTALKAASLNGSDATVSLLLEAGADVNLADGGDYDTALIVASREGHDQVVLQLLKAGADANIASREPFTTALMQASLHGYENIVSMLLSAGADPNIVSAYSGTALIAASTFRYDALVSRLLDAGAQAGPVSGEKTALMAASLRGTENTVSMLINAGCDVNFVSGEYGTALIAASLRSSDRKLSRDVEYGKFGSFRRVGLNERKSSRYSWDRKHPAIVSLLLAAGSQVNLVAGKYGTALIAATRAGDARAMQNLLDAGADINIVAGKYGTALIAASHSRWHIGKDKEQPKLVAMLLAAGADANLVGGKYGTALAVATMRGHKEVIELLLQAGARE